MNTVIFDFDGTISKKGNNIWKGIWQNLGYDISKNSYFSELYGLFLSKKISHQKWCDLTCEAFVNAKMHETMLTQVAKNQQLIDGSEKTFKTLKNNNVDLHILSGGVLQVIEMTLGNQTEFFNSINGNNMVFDHAGYLEKIIGTKYDFEGKLNFVNKYVEEHNISPKEICFVGNGGNDEWVAKSGCKTICINPEDTNEKDSDAWSVGLTQVDNLEKILPEILSDKEREK